MMIVFAIEIAACVTVCIGILVITYTLCHRIEQRKTNDDESDLQKQDELLPSIIDEEKLVQNTLIAHYAQQRVELMERRKVALDDSVLNMTVTITNESGYTSPPSPSHTPHSIYECIGFASMDDLEVSNPLFSSDTSYDDGQVALTIPPR